MAVRFSPKNLSLNVGIFEIEFRTLCAVFVCYCKKKRVTCWLYENHVDIFLFDVLT